MCTKIAYAKSRVPGKQIIIPMFAYATEGNKKAKATCDPKPTNGRVIASWFNSTTELLVKTYISYLNKGHNNNTSSSEGKRSTNHVHSTMYAHKCLLSL